MQRIRTVKPELFRHEELFEAEHTSQLPLRLAFIGLFSCCDREGRFRWKPKQLKLNIFPYDEGFDMERVLDALMTRGFIVKYACRGEMYGCIPSWHKHQCVNHRESASALPGLDDDEVVFERNKNDASITRKVPVNDATEANPCMPMGKGKGTGKEMELERELEGNAHNAQMTCAARDKEASITVFEYWKTVMQLSNAVLDKKRREIICGALKVGYSVEQLCHAIDGCRNTPHNMGKNDRGECYNGLNVIFRDADQIDRFIQNFYKPPQPITSGEKRKNASIQNLQNWLDKKTTQETAFDQVLMEEKHEI